MIGEISSNMVRLSFPRFRIAAYHLCKLLPTRGTRSPLSLGEQSSREISSNANQFELTGSEWTSWPPLKFTEAGGLLERTIRSGENTFSASRPSPIDSVIDHRREGVESKKAINEDVRAVSLTKHTPVYVNAGHGVNSNEIHREWTFLKLNDARTRTHTYTRARE